MKANGYTVQEHFDNCAPGVKSSYVAILNASKKFGPVREDPKKTSIHLVRRTAFAGIATRKETLILTLKSDSDVQSERIFRREQASANRWHLEVRIAGRQQIDGELLGWLKKAYELSA
jgi:hypothetical protein